jgi:lipoprotein signal peptidase
MICTPTIPAVTRYLVLHHEWATSIFVGVVTWNVGMAVSTATDSNGLGIWAQLGVAGLIVVAILLMLRRSDRRDAAAQAALHEIESARIADLKAQIDELQQLLDITRKDSTP